MPLIAAPHTFAAGHLNCVDHPIRVEGIGEPPPLALNCIAQRISPNQFPGEEPSEVPGIDQSTRLLPISDPSQPCNKH